MTNREDIIWAAGLFEGEGCITQRVANGKRTGRDQWALELVSTDPDVLLKLQSILGGGISKECWAVKSTKPYQRWVMAARGDVYATLAKLYPFLHARRQARAREAMELLTPIGARCSKCGAVMRGHPRAPYIGVHGGQGAYLCEVSQ